MHFRNFVNLVLLSTALSVQARASPSFPKVTAGDFQLIHTITAAPSRLLANADIPTVPPFVPSADNLIVNTTVPQGEFANLGFIFPSVGDNTNPAVFDGSSINVTVLYTPPGGVETFVFGIDSGPETPQPVGVGFCGFFPAFFVEGVLDSSVLGTYTGRWIVEFGESTQPDAPVDPNSGCGPEPFNITTVEFVRTWEVVEAA
ncbi:hypothetical protein DFH08DRAFT_879805 [Mycena albidolilacea]|uniref:Uncharacterized protein n=1 Tax=Mycena albidolilacea TaxID=1033008 RepID=A0AAD6ZQF7_9AGAR|nr:hypothetical protein DFH08DRAFT_879805 [Mycena albidolilacea]